VGSAWKILSVTIRSLWGSPDVTDSREKEKRNQGQFDFLKQKIW